MPKLTSENQKKISKNFQKKKLKKKFPKKKKKFQKKNSKKSQVRPNPARPQPGRNPTRPGQGPTNLPETKTFQICKKSSSGELLYKFIAQEVRFCHTKKK